MAYRETKVTDIILKEMVDIIVDTIDPERIVAWLTRKRLGWSEFRRRPAYCGFQGFA